MLQPREADIPALFLALVVLPLVTYILLGKWSEASKKKEKVDLLAQLAAKEALHAEVVTTSNVIPVVSSSKNGFHVCARCFGPAMTRCSRCKSVRYCSGKCQIIHWRQGHKQECQRLETTSNASPKLISNEESFHETVSLNDNLNSLFFAYATKQPMQETAPCDEPNKPTNSNAAPAIASIDASHNSMTKRKLIDKRSSVKSNREILKREHTALFSPCEDAYDSGFTTSNFAGVIPSKEPSTRYKLGNDDPVVLSEECSRKHNMGPPYVSVHGHTAHESHRSRGQSGSLLESGRSSGISSSLYSEKDGQYSHEIQMNFTLDKSNFLGEGLPSNIETTDLTSSLERVSSKGRIKSKSTVRSSEPRTPTSPRSMTKASMEYTRSEAEMKECLPNDSKVPHVNASTTVSAQGSNGLSDSRIMKMMGLKKLSKLENRKKIKVLFPYEEFVKFFQCEVWGLSPRGLLNCGNSCYANAVLQCLSSTKPLIIYMLQKSHSRTCCAKNWCLMCELEQHAMMLREGGGPLSPSRILSHMRSIGCRMGDGSQEDAHEFLRLLVTSMQSICLERLGGEKEVDLRLQETTFIQHTFGGHLRSKVKCLRCRHESEQYENIMDLTLEIHGWVESLEDALTQFTAPEDLDGENMYRCGRCASYVKARKQLSIHEAPNILTIVLKRFQEGSYGKISKFITFPDMLDMIPFMTGTGDSPPLYMLYAVVVHLDTLNASFSGHYVSYVKDLQGTWLRIDDTEVQPVPMSQVMSEGAYILFYSRSCPRPPRACNGRPTLPQAPASVRHSTSKIPKSSKPGQNKPENSMGNSEISNRILRNANRNILPMRETYAEPMSIEFSDATSSDWSLFTSSDESSFTTESTRDSFSTVDYSETFGVDSISSIFNTGYPQEYSSNHTVSYRRFEHSKPQTRFFFRREGLCFGLIPFNRSTREWTKSEESKTGQCFYDWGFTFC